jgi:hypothetical protein
MSHADLFIEQVEKWYETQDDLKGVVELYFENMEVIKSQTGIHFNSKDLKHYFYFAAVYGAYSNLVNNLRYKNKLLK